MLRHVLHRVLAAVDDHMVLERNEAVWEATSQIGEGVAAERISHERDRDDARLQRCQVLVKAGPVPAGEDRIAPDRIDLTGRSNGTFEEPAVAPGQVTRGAELRQRTCVVRVSVARRVPWGRPARGGASIRPGWRHAREALHDSHWPH